jgi:hypothetical protein
LISSHFVFHLLFTSPLLQNGRIIYKKKKKFVCAWPVFHVDCLHVQDLIFNYDIIIWCLFHIIIPITQKIINNKSILEIVIWNFAPKYFKIVKNRLLFSSSIQRPQVMLEAKDVFRITLMRK